MKCPTCDLELVPSKFGLTLVCANGHGFSQNAAELHNARKDKTPPKK